MKQNLADDMHQRSNLADRDQLKTDGECDEDDDDDDDLEDFSDQIKTR